MIKSLSLSLDEIRQLIEISDPEHRRQVLESLSETAETPQPEIDPETYSGSHPMALRIAQKIRSKAQAAIRRRETRRARMEQTETEAKPTVAPEPIIEPCADDLVTIEFTEATVRRLLWLKQHNKLWRKAIFCIAEAITGSEIPARIARQLLDNLNVLYAYIRPLISEVTDYVATPRRLRPQFATIAPEPTN